MQSESPSSSSRRRSRHDSFNLSSTKRTKITESTQPTMTTPRARGKLPDSGRPQAFQPFSGAKKLVIKNLRAPSAARDKQVEEYYAQTQTELEKALEAVFSAKRLDVPFERLYRGVEDVCRRGDADKVYRSLKLAMETHVQDVIQPRVQQNGGRSNYETLKCLLSEWQTFNSQMNLIRGTFSYLDRTYVLRQKLPSINDMTISFFRKMAFPSQDRLYESSPGKRLIRGMCELIDFDRREHNLPDSALLKSSFRMLYILGVYVKHFEPFFLEQSRPFFKNFAESRRDIDLRTYIQDCETLLQREHYRVLEYNIDSATEKQLMDISHVLLIEDYTSKLLDPKNVAQLLENRNIESVKGLYELLRLSKIQRELKSPWDEYIRNTVATIIGDKKRCNEMIIRLLSLRRSLDMFVRDALSKDEEFRQCMRGDFGAAMNNPKVSACWSNGISKIGEMIAKHVDMLLRGGLRTLPKDLLSDTKDRATAEREGQASTADEDAELDRQLDHAIELIRLVAGKDAVEAFYKKDLARRLLMARSASQDAERTMLSKLKSECGSNFTHNMEQMFKDQELAKEEMESYKTWCVANTYRQSPLVFETMVLSASAWPTYPVVQLNLPDDVATQSERFDKFYKSKHTGRTLTWMHSLAHCAIKARFPKGDKELLVSAFQAVVLLLFNSVPEGGFLAYEQISKATGLKGHDLSRTLQSLACGRARVLSKHPKSRDVNSTDTFTFNKSFSDPKNRVKINQIQHKETQEENTSTHERIVLDRRFETQAAIVRIMKSRKKMGHAELQAEVLGMMNKRGLVEPSQIKKEIERLIEKDYIDREGNFYVYLA